MEDIAIKVPKLSNFSTDSVRDFYDEAKTALQFNHENVLRCWGISMGKNHNTNRDIDPSRHNLENCLPLRILKICTIILFFIGFQCLKTIILVLLCDKIDIF